MDGNLTSFNNLYVINPRFDPMMTWK